MSDKIIIKNYLAKIKKLREHNDLYFNKNSPKISDEDYDKLKIEILDLEKKYPNIKSKDSPSLNVGFTPSKNFTKLKHRVQMLSLSNVFSKEDLINFEKKILNFLDFKKDYKIEYSVEPKIDGISASLTYKKGNLIYGVSRGDGKEGELITENLKTIKDIPQKIFHKEFPDDIEIRGEVFIENRDFEKISNNFANARNAASGSLRQKDSNETKKYDLSKNTIGDSIKIATSGLTIGNIIPDNAEERIPVKIYLPSDEKTFSSIERTNISTSQGLVPLSNFVDKQKREKIFTIGKQQGMRTLVIDANIKEELNASAVKQDLANWVNELNLPSNVFIKFAGEAEDSASSMSFLIIAFLGALVAIFIVLITLFNSFYHTFIILFSVILSIGGILLGTLLLGLKFSIVFSGLGIVACMGIVVNNNIILIDSYRKELSKNDNNIYDAILIACKNRIRPIFLTTITTITGLLPSALQISLDIFDRTIAYKSEETYFFVLLAWSLIWGIGFASFATLFVTPALLALPKSLSNIFYSKSKILNDKVLID